MSVMTSSVETLQSTLKIITMHSHATNPLNKPDGQAEARRRTRSDDTMSGTPVRCSFAPIMARDDAHQRKSTSSRSSPQAPGGAGSRFGSTASGHGVHQPSPSPSPAPTLLDHFAGNSNTNKWKVGSQGSLRSMRTGRGPVVCKWEVVTYDDKWATDGLPFTSELLPPGVQYLCGQPEYNTTVDEEGRRKQHFQGFVAFTEPQPCKVVQQTLGFSPERFWGAVPVGNDMVYQRIAYTKKDVCAVKGPRGESLWREAGVLSDNLKRSGDKHRDIVQIMKEGGTEMDVLERFPQMGLQFLGNLQKMKGIYCRPRDRPSLQVYLIYGETRVGKSHFVRRILLDGDNSEVFNKPHPASPTSTDFWPLNYNGATRVLFDDFHPKKYNIVDMLNYCQEYAQSIQVKGGYEAACWTSVYITTNVPIEQWYDHLPDSFDGNIRALKARIPECNRMHMKVRPPAHMIACTFAEMKAYQDSVVVEAPTPAATTIEDATLAGLSKEHLVALIRQLVGNASK